MTGGTGHGASRERATLADRQYLRRPTSTDPWVPALELAARAEPEPEALAAAVAAAIAAEPRFTVRPESGGRGVRWRAHGDVPPVDVSDDADEQAWRSRVIDRAFDAREHPLRVSLRGASVLLAWSHAVSDAAGGVGFGSLVARALAGVPPIRQRPVMSRRDVGLTLWRQALSPRAIWSFVDKARSHGVGPHRELEPVGPIGAESSGVIATVDSPHGGSAGESFTGRVVAAVDAACRALMPSKVPVTLMLPVNLRTKERWYPAGNFVGNVEIVFADPPTVASASREVARSREPERLATWWATGLRETLPEVMGWRGGGGEARLERTAVVNNLGRVETSLYPEVESLAFHGPTAVDFPSVSLVGLDGRVAVCARVREHQGGAEVAGKLLDAVLSGLSDAPD